MKQPRDSVPPRIFGILAGGAGAPEVDALRRVDPRAVVSDDPEASFPAGVDLMVLDLDVGAPPFPAGGEKPGPTLLCLLPRGLDPEAAELPPEAAWLARPFAPATLVAVCRELLSSGGSPAIRPRAVDPEASRRAYEEARSYAARVLEAAAAAGRIPLEAGRPVAERIHTELLRSNRLVTRSLEPHGPFDLASHSANVAVIAAKIARGMALGTEAEVETIHAGLVHDIGMTRLEEEVLRRRGPLTDAERDEVRRHPLYGAELLAGEGERWEWLRRAVEQEHERRGGQGYPYGLVGDAIDPIARILGVADVFEALSHPRSYRSPFTALDALETIAGMQGEYFEPGVVAALVNEISAFPQDSYVQLSTGAIGRVVAVNPTNLLRPAVQVLWDREWRRLEEPRVVELTERPGISVIRALLEAELPIG